MSVIGSLDEQVDAALIAPLTKKRPPDEKVAPVSPSEHDAPPAAARREETAENPNDDSNRSALPVWLL